MRLQPATPSGRYRPRIIGSVSHVTITTVGEDTENASYYNHLLSPLSPVTSICRHADIFR